MQTLIRWIVTAILGWLSSTVSEWLRQREERKANEAENKRLREALKNAKTPDEVDAAAEAIARRFGRS